MNAEQFLSWFQEVVRPTESMFREVPQSRLEWKLTPTSFSIGQLLSHIPRALWFNARVIDQADIPLKSLREILISNRRQPSFSVEEAISSLHSSITDFSSAVIRLGDDGFQNGMLDTPQLGRIPAWRFCFFAVEHHIHHLMELHIALKFIGVKVNTRTLYS
jgi:uncharacterized damage-inducible protein DinB